MRVSEHSVEWERFPAPSLRELLSAAKLRECTPMNVTAQKFQSLYALVRKPSARRNHRTTLPQSRPLGVPAPSEREPGGVRAIHRTARKPQRCGRFSSPLRNSKVFYIPPFNGRHSLSLASLDSSLREGAGIWCVPFNVPPGSRKVTGDFRRPYEKFPFTRQAEA